MNGASRPVRLAGFRHTALISDSDESLRRRLVPALRRCLAIDQPVLMVVRGHTATVIRAALGTQADKLEWGDHGAFYRRMGHAFENFRRYLAAKHASGQRTCVVAEPDIVTDPHPDAPVDRPAEYLAYESMCNEAFPAYGCPVTCLWDSHRHSASVIGGVRRVHDHELTVNGTVPNPGFVPTADYLTERARIALPPPPPVADLDVPLSGPSDLAPVRDAVAAFVLRSGFDSAAGAEMVLATSEVATNGLTHGSPPVRVRCWRQADTLVVQVDDAGGKPIPPATGYTTPDRRAWSGRGLWLARQLADVVTTHTAGTTTTVRMFFPQWITDRR